MLDNVFSSCSRLVIDHQFGRDGRNHLSPFLLNFIFWVSCLGGRRCLYPSPPGLSFSFSSLFYSRSGLCRPVVLPSTIVLPPLCFALRPPDIFSWVIRFGLTARFGFGVRRSEDCVASHRVSFLSDSGLA